MRSDFSFKYTYVRINTRCIKNNRIGPAQTNRFDWFISRKSLARKGKRSVRDPGEGLSLKQRVRKNVAGLRGTAVKRSNERSKSTVLASMLVKSWPGLAPTRARIGRKPNWPLALLEGPQDEETREE